MTKFKLLDKKRVFAFLVKLKDNEKFVIQFIKKDGTERSITGVIDREKMSSNGKQRYEPSEHGLFLIFDIEDQSVKAISLDTVISIKYNNIKITSNEQFSKIKR